MLSSSPACSLGSFKGASSKTQALLPSNTRRSVPRPCRCTSVATIVEPGSTVLVAGSTGGVGQLLTTRLLETGYHVKALTRDIEKAAQLFGGNRENLENITLCVAFQIVEGDLREEEALQKIVSDVDAVCCVVGTTAFPSKRWEGNNSSEMTDKIGVKNLISATPESIKRFVLTSSAGVLRSDKFPFVMMNMFNVLTYKRMAEKALEMSGLPYTIFRPSRLTDAPYTSYDLNTLLEGKRGARMNVNLSLDDCYSGEASRICVAEAIVQSLQLDSVEGHAFSIESTMGEGPEQNHAEWAAKFASL